MIVVCRNTPPGTGSELSVEFLSHGVRGVTIDSQPLELTSSSISQPSTSQPSRSKPDPESRPTPVDPTSSVPAFIDFASSLRAATDPEGELDAIVLLPPELDADADRIALALRRRTEIAVEFDGRADDDLASRVAAFAANPDAAPRLDREPPFDVIETERLILDFASEAQLDDYYAAIIDSDIFDTLIWDGPSAPSDLYDHTFLMKQFAARDRRGLFSRSVVERKTGRVVGGVSWRPYDSVPGTGDVGYALAPGAHGRGFATEALRALVDHAFTIGDAQRLEALVLVGNEASAKVARKCGFELEGIRREGVQKRGCLLDQWTYAIPRSHWSEHGSRPKKDEPGIADSTTRAEAESSGEEDSKFAGP